VWAFMSFLRKSFTSSRAQSLFCDLPFLRLPHRLSFFRKDRDQQDWWLTQSSKLWLPLNIGPVHQRNVMKRSIIFLAMKHFALGFSQFKFLFEAEGTEDEEDHKETKRTRETDVKLRFGDLFYK